MKRIRKILRLMDDDGEIHDVVIESQKIQSDRPWMRILGGTGTWLSWQPKILSLRDDEEE